MPDSFADEVYHGIHPSSWSISPASDSRCASSQRRRRPFNSDANAAKQRPDFLIQELPARLAKGPVLFHPKSQLPEPGDPRNNATKPWPDDRKLVHLGTITIDKTVRDSDAAQKTLLFLPGKVTDGIEPSGDPILDVRDSNYAISFPRRQS